MADQATRIGIIGTGKISGIYLQNGRDFRQIEIAACADLVMERAREQAATYGVPRAVTVEELLADDTIPIVVNLTIPDAHASVGLAVLQAGKSVYNEKPLAIAREDGQRLLTLAREKRLRVGCA